MQICQQWFPFIKKIFLHCFSVFLKNIKPDTLYFSLHEIKMSNKIENIVIFLNKKIGYFVDNKSYHRPLFPLNKSQD